MGQIVKQVSSHSTSYRWYPGEKKEWLRGALALAIGGAGYVVLHLLTHRTLLAAVVATSVTAGFAGFNFGRRDSRELHLFAELAKSRYVRRRAAVHTGRAAWRGIAEGTGGAAAAVIIVNLSEHGFVADWLLPIVPAIVGALGHQAGMMIDRMAVSQSTDGPAKKSDAAPAPAPTPAPAPAAEAGAAVAAAAPVADASTTEVTPAPSASRVVASVPMAALSPYHAAVAMPTNVSSFKHAKPPMPLSAAIAARADLAHIAHALGAETLSESHQHAS